MRSVILALLTISIATTPSLSQGTTPRAITEEFFRHLNARRWARAAELIDSETATQLHEWQLEGYRQLATRRAATVEQMLATDPAMPRDVAEYLVRRQAWEDSARSAVSDLWPGWSLDQLQGLAPRAFAAVYLEVRDRRSECERFRKTRVPDSLYHWEAIGEVLEGDVAHVVYREHHPLAPPAMAIPPTTVGVVSLRLSAEGWRLTDLHWFPGLPTGCR